MQNLTKTCVILVVCLVAAEGAKAVDPSQPFVVVRMSRDPLYLGEVCGPNLKQVAAKVTARVVANCPYHISASFPGLEHQRHRVAISPKHMTVKVNDKEVPIGAGHVTIASQGPTPYGGVDIPIELQVGVTSASQYPAGRYRGSLVIKVTAGHF